MLPLGRVCKQPLLSLTRICQNSKLSPSELEGVPRSGGGVCYYQHSAFSIQLSVCPFLQVFLTKEHLPYERGGWEGWSKLRSAAPPSSPKGGGVCD